MVPTLHLDNRTHKHPLNCNLLPPTYNILIFNPIQCTLTIDSTCIRTIDLLYNSIYPII